MARIIGLKEKQAALKDIQLSLRALSPLDEFMADANPSNEYTISFEVPKTTTNEGDKGTARCHKATLKCDDKEKINDLVRAYKKTIVDHIQELANKYEIELDEDDLALMKL